MRLERDNIPLDKDFPFQIFRGSADPEEQQPGTWHWHSYFEITCVLEGRGIILSMDRSIRWRRMM